MSGSGDNRWRGGPSRQSSQRHANNANRDRGNGGQGDGRGGNAAWGGAGPAQEQHVPVRGFNASEAKNTLKKAPGQPKAAFYKPTGKDGNNQRSGGPWGSKGIVSTGIGSSSHGSIKKLTSAANTMANGKDFFVELRKQIASLQRTGPPVGG